jgi:hypothetical protein
MSQSPSWLDVPDIDPEASLVEVAWWVLNCIAQGHKIFNAMADWPGLAKSAALDAIEMARDEGKFDGALTALRCCPSTSVSADIQKLADLRASRVAYERTRLMWIERVAAHLVSATAMHSRAPKVGRPRRQLPDYELLKDTNAGDALKRAVMYEAFEWDIAIKMADIKRSSGRFTGLTALIDQYMSEGKLSDQGDTEERIKHLARQIISNRDLYLPPTINELRQRARERVKNSEEFSPASTG